MPPLHVLNVTESNSNTTLDTNKIASDSFLSFVRQISATQQNTIRGAISTFDAENAIPTNTSENNTRHNIISSTPRTNNILHTNQDLLDSSDRDESTDQTNLMKNLVQSMNDFAINQSCMLEHKNNPNIPYVPIISKLKKTKSRSHYTKLKQAKLTKKIIEAAD